MSEYLDRKQVIELYEKYQPSLATNVYEFGEKLKALPIVKEETSRQHGEWIDVNGDGSIMKCSVCGDMVCCKNNNFCPNCGADMRKSGEAE